MELCSSAVFARHAVNTSPPTAAAAAAAAQNESDEVQSGWKVICALTVVKWGRVRATDNKMSVAAEMNELIIIIFQ